MVDLSGVMMIVQAALTADGVDVKEYSRLLEFQLAAGVATIQSPQVDDLLVMSDDEIAVMLQTLVGVCKGAANTVATVTFQPAGARAVQFARLAADAGVDAVKVQAPVHFGADMSDDDMIAYVAAVAESVDVPILLYNNPRRCSFNLSLDLVSRLAESFPQVQAVQESRFDQALALMDGLGERISVVCKYPYWVPSMAYGAPGFHTSASYCPHQLVELYEACSNADWVRARTLSARYRALFELHQIAPAPVVTKYCLEQIGFAMGHSRLPQPAQLPQRVRERVERTLYGYELEERPADG